jgi:3-dehydroquinate dehydratase type I
LIVVPIVSKHFNDAVADIKQANSLADTIELRLDFLSELNETILEELIRACELPVIVTNRKKPDVLGFSEMERFFLMRKAIDFGASFIDVELESEKKLIESIRNYKGKAKLIVSFHDFSSTPPREILQSILKKEVATGADILKIVTTAKTASDAEAVFGLIPAAKNQGKEIIVFCMGELGKQSRIDCIAKGSLFTYASLDKNKQSAPGQLTVKEMRKALRLD